MKSSAFLTALFLFANCAVMAQANTNDTQKPSFEFGIQIRGGALTMDHNALGNLISPSAEGYTQTAYFTGGINVSAKILGFYYLFGSHTARVNYRPNAEESLDIQHNFANMALGYKINLHYRLEAMPYAGVSASMSRVTKSDLSASQNLTGYFQGAPNAHHARVIDQWHGRAGIQFSTPIILREEIQMALVPARICLYAEYMRAFGNTNWEVNGARQTGPTVFNQNFNVGLAMEWWL